MPKVFLNPGHCLGIDPGAVNTGYGVTEAEVAKDIGERVAEYLRVVGYETHLLQSDNLYYDGEGDNVCETANKWQADLFVSIHCNAFNGRATGTETLCYGLYSQGSKLAQCIQRQIVDNLHTVDRGVKARTDLVVLKRTNMPAVLVETVFIDNNSDCLLLIHKVDEFARAIARGITDYFA